MASFFFLTVSALLVVTTEGDHIRGGYLAWWPVDDAGTVEVVFEMTVRREGENIRCNQFNLGELLIEGSVSILATGPGLDGVPIAQTDYVCTGFNVEQGVVHGQGSFQYTFPQIGATYDIRVEECCLPDYADNLRFSLQTTVDLSLRNDTGKINNPPLASSPLLVILRDRCITSQKIFAVDNDGDEIRCRFAEGAECGDSGCVPNPNWLTLDESCDLTFDRPPKGNYYVALIMEDFPPGKDMPLSAVPLTFTIVANGTSGPCDQRPTFDPSITLPCDTILAGETYQNQVLVTPTNNTQIADLFVSAPKGFRKTREDLSTGQTVFHLEWTPSSEQYRTHVISYQAVDSRQQSSEIRYLTIYAGATPVMLQEASNLPSGIVPSDNREWSISFDQPIQLSAIRRLIYLEQISPVRVIEEIIDVSTSPLVSVQANTLHFTTSSPLSAGAVYQFVLEPDLVVPLLSCADLPGHSGVNFPSNFEWQFTVGFPLCYQNCSSFCLSEIWEQELCIFYAELNKWLTIARQCGLDLPSEVTPINQGSPDDQWMYAHSLWQNLLGEWQEATQRELVSITSNNENSLTSLQGNPLNSVWYASLQSWNEGYQFWMSEVIGRRLTELAEITISSDPDVWKDILTNWTRSANSFDMTYGDQCIALD